jgi:hypothetical protein
VEHSEETIAWLLTAAALSCTLVPFYKGLRVCLSGWVATRRVDPQELRKAGNAQPTSGVEPFALLMMRVLGKSLRENEQGADPSDFIFDASRQYVMNEFEAHFTRMISMFGSLLPPIGFIGTTGGMLMLFLSMSASNSSLELGALALALTSSIFALVGFSILEGMKIRLYSRLLIALGDVQALFDAAEGKREARRVAAA